VGENGKKCSYITRLLVLVPQYRIYIICPARWRGRYFSLTHNFRSIRFPKYGIVRIKYSGSLFEMTKFFERVVPSFALPSSWLSRCIPEFASDKRTFSHIYAPYVLIFLGEASACRGGSPTHIFFLLHPGIH